MPEKKNNKYKNLMLKKYFYKDITKAENKVLDEILKNSKDARIYQEKFLKKLRILDKIPVIKTSKSFENDLFSKLNIKKQETIGWYERMFGMNGGLRFATASIPLLIASWIILRGFIVPAYKSVSAPEDYSTKIKTGLTRLDRRITRKINRYFLKLEDAPGSVKTETKIIYKNIKLIKKGSASLPAVKMRGRRRLLKSKLKLTDLKEKKKTTRLMKDSFDDKIRMRGSVKSAARKKVDDSKNKTLAGSVQKKSGTIKKKEVSKSLERKSDKAQKPKAKKMPLVRDEEKQRSVLQFFKKKKKDNTQLLSIINQTVPGEARVNIVLSQPASSNRFYSHIKKIKKVIKPLLPRNVKISLNLSVSKPESDKKDTRRKSRTTVLLLWVFIELLIRIWLVYDLKKRSAGKSLYTAALLFGSFFIPVYVFLRKK